MTHDDDQTHVVLLNSESQYLKNYHKSVNSWIDCFIENQKQHVLSVMGSEADRNSFDAQDAVLTAPVAT